MNCRCGRTISFNLHNNTFYHGFCSRYCWLKYQDPESYPNEAPIPADCHFCGKEIILKRMNSQQNFCSKSCSAKIMQGKRNFRDYYILTLLKLFGPQTANSIAQKCTLSTNAITSHNISNLLRKYASRGVISRTGPEPLIYQLTPLAMQQNIGSLVVDKLKLNR